jgi:hypothetical protein
MQQDRGREAEAPWQITARGWADILYRVWKDTGKKNLSLTYYLLLATDHEQIDTVAFKHRSGGGGALGGLPPNASNEERLQHGRR